MLHNKSDNPENETYWATQIIAIDYFGNDRYYYFCVICQKKSPNFKIKTMLKRLLEHIESDLHRSEIMKKGVGIMEMRNAT